MWHPNETSFVAYGAERNILCRMFRLCAHSRRVVCHFIQSIFSSLELDVHRVFSAAWTAVCIDHSRGISNTRYLPCSMTMLVSDYEGILCHVRVLQALICWQAGADLCFDHFRPLMVTRRPTFIFPSQGPHHKKQSLCCTTSPSTTSSPHRSSSPWCE